MSFKVENTGFTIATTYCFVLTILPLLFHLLLLPLCSDLVSFVNDWWCWLLLCSGACWHLASDSQTDFLSFPDWPRSTWTGSASPSTFDSTWKWNMWFPLETSLWLFWTFRNWSSHEFHSWQIIFCIYIKILYFHHAVGAMRGTPKKQCYLSVWIFGKLLNELSSECS